MGGREGGREGGRGGGRVERERKGGSEKRDLGGGGRSVCHSSSINFVLDGVRARAAQSYNLSTHYEPYVVDYFRPIPYVVYPVDVSGGGGWHHNHRADE